MTPAAVVIGALAGATVWSFQLAWAATASARVRGRLAVDTGEPGPVPGARGAGRAALPPPPGWLSSALARAGVTWEPAAVWHGWLGASAVAAAGAAVVGGPALAGVALVAVVAGPIGGLRLSSGRGDRALEGAVPGALERIARNLRSGGSVIQALEEAGAESSGELGRDLGAVVREVEAGEPLVAALDRWAQRRPLATIRLAVAALALGAETGGAQAQALDGLAATLRDRLAVAAEVRALSSQARLSALVISLAPLAFAGFAAVTDPRSADFLLRTPAGIACLVVGLTLDGIAAWWMARLTRTPT